MIDPRFEIQYDSRGSCTIDEAVAKLLGWMRSTAREPYIKLSADGCMDPEQLPNILTLPCALDQFIADERNSAKNAYRAALHLEDYETADQWDTRVEYWDEIAGRAINYKMAIQEELRSSKSQLKLDSTLTKEVGMPHITLPSLERWARTRFGSSILGNDYAPISDPKIDEPTAHSGTPVQKTATQQRFDALRAEIEEICDRMENPTAGQVMSELRKKIGTENTCVLRNLGDGIEWENARGVTKTLTIGALRERIQTWKNHRLSKG